MSTSEPEPESQAAVAETTTSGGIDCKKEMEEWFETVATQEQADAMTSRQLDYEFTGDNLGSTWWLTLQKLGFQYNQTKNRYSVPKKNGRSPVSLHTKEYTAKDIYRRLDILAIPQLSSVMEEFDSYQDQDLIQNMTSQEMEWWKDIRDQLIFYKFRSEIEETVSTTKEDDSSNRTNKRKRLSTETTTTRRRSSSRIIQVTSSNSNKNKSSITVADAGAELLLNKKSKKKKSKYHPPAHGATSVRNKIVFPTVQEYATFVQNNFNFENVLQMEDSYKQSFFKEWRFNLYLNHSLLLYGIGSKRQLLNAFASNIEENNDGDVLTIDGFDKDVTIEGILDLLVCHWLHGEEPTLINEHRIFRKDDIGDDDSNNDDYGSQVYPSNIVVQRAMGIAVAIAIQVQISLRPVYIVLHNIDGVALRNSIAQEALSVLVHCSSMMTPTTANMTQLSQRRRRRNLNAIRLVVSVDHINGPALLWDTLTQQRFQWLWKHVPTHRPYVEEITQSTLGLQMQHQQRSKSQRKRISAEEDDDDDLDEEEEEADVLNVLKSLAPRPTESLQVLANLQLASAQSGVVQQDPDETIWVDYSALLKKCQLECIVTGDHQLRLFLKEFFDHEIVERQGQTLRIPYSTETLIQIVNFQHDDEED